MTLPRQLLPNCTYLVTRRVTQRQFLLKPTQFTTQIFTYCLAVAAERSGIQLHAVCVMSNHWHAVLTDPHANLPEFLAYAHKYVAKALNALFGRSENLWASQPPSVVKLETAEDVLDKALYVICNPVASELVARAKHWPGLLKYLPGHSQVVQRPDVFFRRQGPMPGSARLELTVPPQFGHLSASAFAELVQSRIAAREAEVALEMSSGGRSFLGRRGVIAQRSTSCPRSKEGRGGLNPRLACRSKWHRIEALQRQKSFQVEYRQAYVEWRGGNRDAVFPNGTYALRVRAGVACHPL
jgi:putative transposase